MQNSKRSLLIFIGLLIIEGLFHIIEHTIHDISALGDPHYAIVTLFFCLEFVIFSVLIGIYETPAIKSKDLYDCSGYIYDIISDSSCL